MLSLTYRGVVEVKVSFLDTLAMVSLRVGQTKEAFLEERTGIMLVEIIPVHQA